MRDRRKDSWGSRFLNMMKELASKMASATAESNPFAEWMRAEMRLPILWLRGLADVNSRAGWEGEV